MTIIPGLLFLFCQVSLLTAFFSWRVCNSVVFTHLIYNNREKKTSLCKYISFSEFEGKELRHKVTVVPATFLTKHFKDGKRSQPPAPSRSPQCWLLLFPINTLRIYYRHTFLTANQRAEVTQTWHYQQHGCCLSKRPRVSTWGGHASAGRKLPGQANPSPG